MKLTLTQKEMALLFEVARIGYEGCGMWLTGLVNDNFSWFNGSKIMKRFSWSKERVGGVMASLADKGLIGTDIDTIVGINKISYLNIDAKFEEDENGEWVVIEGNDLYDVFKEWEKDYPEYCDNPFKEDKASKMQKKHIKETPTDKNDDNLSATAPEMLQLLKDILVEVRPEISRINELYNQTIFNPVATETIDMAKDLIARAEGEQIK